MKLSIAPRLRTAAAGPLTVALVGASFLFQGSTPAGPLPLPTASDLARTTTATSPAAIGEGSSSAAAPTRSADGTATGSPAASASGETPTATASATPTQPPPTANPTPPATPAPTPRPATPPPAPPPPVTGSYALGMWTGQPWEQGNIDAGINLMGRKPAILLTYQSWNGRRTEFLDDDARVIAARGASWMMTWEPDGTLKDIAAGKHDAYIIGFAKQAAAWGKTFYLRYMHEMNGDWYPWGVYRGHNGNTAADFLGAWRHTHDLFVANGASNVKWVWSPNITYPNGEYPFTNLYPGSSYVDWVALDGYNWGGQVGGHPAWQSWTQIFQASYSLVVGYGKPIVIAETASAESGGNKAAWITSAFLSEIPKTMPRIRAVIWFNQSAETDFRINSSNSSLQAFRQVAASSAWQARLP